MHVGLNLVFLVPGATGGMEVAVRETIPALAAAAPPGTRFTAFVSRDAGEGPWGEIETVVVPVSPRRRANGSAASSSYCREPQLARRR